MTRSFRAVLPAVAVVAVLTLAACGGNDEAAPQSDAPPPVEDVSVVTEADALAEATEDVPAPEPTPPAEGTPPAAEEVEPAATEVPPPPASSEETLQDLLDAVPGDDVAIVWGTGDLEQGDIRLSFLVVDDEGELTQAPNAELAVGKVGEQEGSEIDAEQIPATAAATSTAVLESIDAAPHEHEGDPNAPHDHIDATDLYVAQVELSEPGLYWAIATPSEGGIQAFGTFEVREESVAPGVGDAAIASDTPTLDDGPAEMLTTLEPPAEELLRYSVAESLADGAPFVVTFATPAFCQTRVCGPVVETVDVVRGLYEADGVRFIQVEIYTDNDPNNGVNEWVQEWGLPSEPWTFLVDEAGIIQERFEGAMSARELTDAIDRTLL